MILPSNVERALKSFTESARAAFDEDLVSIILYGSAAEGLLRPSSDVNLLVLLSKFSQAKAAQLREPLRVAQAAIELSAMFLLESELQSAVECFAVKFGDILRRRQILFGSDPFAAVSISREASIIRVRQTLLNLTLRMREAYIGRGLREEQRVTMIANMAGPLRACAAALLELRGTKVSSARDAICDLAASLTDKISADELMKLLSQARQTGVLPPDASESTLFQLIELARLMWVCAEALK
jgi:predicted nucleotidyltransferase